MCSNLMINLVRLGNGEGGDWDGGVDWDETSVSIEWELAMVGEAM